MQQNDLYSLAPYGPINNASTLQRTGRFFYSLITFRYVTKKDKAYSTFNLHYSKTAAGETMKPKTNLFYNANICKGGESTSKVL